MDDIFTIVSDDMPYWIKGHVNHNKDGSYTIFLNGKRTEEVQMETYKHELNHIVNGDFEKEDIDIIEYCAHKRSYI